MGHPTGAGGVTTYTGTSTHHGAVATLVINADGSYTFTQSAPLVHPTKHVGRESYRRVCLHGDGRRRRHGDGVS